MPKMSVDSMDQRTLKSMLTQQLQLRAAINTELTELQRKYISERRECQKTKEALANAEARSEKFWERFKDAEAKVCLGQGLPM